MVGNTSGDVRPEQACGDSGTITRGLSVLLLIAGLLLVTTLVCKEAIALTFDERIVWSMPQAGTASAADDASSGWLGTIKQSFDGGGNLTQQQTAAGTVLADSTGRSPGRISERRRYTSTGTPLTTDFGFVDGTGVPPSVKLPASLPTLSSGLPFWSTTSLGGLTRAGSANGRDGAARLSGLRDQASSRCGVQKLCHGGNGAQG